MRILSHIKTGCFLAVTILVVTSCNTTKHLKEDEYLVEKNYVIDQGKTKIATENIEAFIRQKPNRKMLGLFSYNLWLYNQIDKEKVFEEKEKRNLKYDKINAKRIEKNRIKNEKRAKKGKKPKDPKLKDKEKPTFKESLLDVAEEPVILDSAAANQTANQITRYLFSKGYFYPHVKDSMVYNKRRKKVKVFYVMRPGKPYTIEKLNYSIPDTTLARYIYTDSTACMIKRGTHFDADAMQSERERITGNLLNNGYYYFEQDYVYYNIDSLSGNKKVNVSICTKQFPVFASSDKDSIIYTNHQQYKINDIYVITENLKGSFRDEYFKDTSVYNDILFLMNHPLLVRKSVVAGCISLEKNTLFKKSVAEKTYKRLLNLGIFKSVLIQFVKSDTRRNRLDCYIICVPIVKQSLSAQTEGTNTSGNLGIDGSLVYQNRNIFKGAELFEIILSGAVSAQKQFNTNTTVNPTDITDINNVKKTFNTVQFGPEVNFSVPRTFFPFSLVPFFRNTSTPHTFVKTSLNYQSRPEFNRSITDISYGFGFKSKNGVFRHDIIPIEVYAVKARLFGGFEQDLKNVNDYFLLNSFINHITTLSKYSITFNNQSIAKGKVVNYLKVDLSSSGNILRAYNELTGQKKDSLGRYKLFNVPFAHFLKVNMDYRIYISTQKKSRLVMRVAAGLGKPLVNLNVLPYEQSFFSGGPNSVRAWRARTLGPGGYAQPDSVNTRYDKIGDMILEGNMEYRFHIFKDFYGAWFTDIGNIWLLHDDPNKPNGKFDVTKFYNEFAVGSGFGIRWDLSFFVLRLDAAVPIKNPKLPEGNRFTFDKKPLQQTVINFGIGYPF